MRPLLLLIFAAGCTQSPASKSETYAKYNRVTTNINCALKSRDAALQSEVNADLERFLRAPSAELTCEIRSVPIPKGKSCTVTLCHAKKP